VPVTLNDIIRRTRSKLNEPAYPTAPNSTVNNPAPHFYTDFELTDWVNDCCRDIARRSEDLQSISQIPTTPGLGAYPAPLDCIRVNRLEFTPSNSTQVYPIDLKTRAEADQYIGFNPNIQSSYPFISWLWGTPGSTVSALRIYFYPVFAQAGNIACWYYRQPTRLNNPVTIPTDYNQTLDYPEGWDDAIVLYAESMALQKARSPEWQTRMQMYDQMIQYLIDISRQWHDQTKQITFLSDQYMRWPGRGDLW
jgi:hypothetical protein